jgi:hypothetical protein
MEDPVEVTSPRRPFILASLWSRLLLDGEETTDEAIVVVTRFVKAIVHSDATRLREATRELRAATRALTTRARQLARMEGVGLSRADECELTKFVLALPWRARSSGGVSPGRPRRSAAPHEIRVSVSISVELSPRSVELFVAILAERLADATLPPNARHHSSATEFWI